MPRQCQCVVCVAQSSKYAMTVSECSVCCPVFKYTQTVTVYIVCVAQSSKYAWTVTAYIACVA